jgi:large subunit ribosomal protein L15
MRLNELRDNDGARKARIRVGRGKGSGKGKTGGRGLNGQKSRSGVSLVGFEGGQMPLYRRLPKRGFTNISKIEFDVVNIGSLQSAIDQKKIDIAKVIDAQAMKDAGLVSGNQNGVRLLGMGELSTKLNVEVAGASKTAILAVEKMGGKVVLPKPTKVLLEAREQSAKLYAKKASLKGKSADASAITNVENDSKSAKD